MFTVHCPKCSSQDIREKNVAYTELRVLDWDLDEDDGIPVPADYDTDSSPDWEAEDTARQYVCYACKGEWRLDDLFVVEDAQPQED